MGITRPRPDGGVKTSITRPRPDGGVIMKQEISPRGIYPAVVLSALGVQNILRPRKIQAEVVQIFKVGDLSYLLRVCDDNINQDMTCLIILF